MLRLRHELHFREGKSLDVLDRGTQLEIADEWGYQGSDGILPVEQFMQDYFDNTRNVRYAAAYFVDDAQSRPLIHRAVESVLSKGGCRAHPHGTDSYLGTEGLPRAICLQVFQISCD